LNDPLFGGVLVCYDALLFEFPESLTGLKNSLNLGIMQDDMRSLRNPFAGGGLWLTGRNIGFGSIFVIEPIFIGELALLTG
jgi:hypothetical protein